MAAGGGRVSAAGRWFVTPHAVERYVERIEPGLTYDEALGRLVALSERAHFVREKVTVDFGRVEIWRGPKPTRIRCYVVPGGEGEMDVLVTVLPTFDGAPPRTVRVARGDRDLGAPQAPTESGSSIAASWRAKP